MYQPVKNYQSSQQFNSSQFLFQNRLHVPIIVTLRTLTMSLNSEIGI